MKFTDLTGQNRMTEQLVRSMQIGRTVHAHILEGGEGTGKRTLAQLCARALNCDAPEHLRPCGECPSCLRAEAGNHPDITVLRPVIEKGREKAIGVDAVRELIEKVAIRPYEGGYGCVIIERASLLTVAAQNALLKTLETPPENVVFFLLVESATSLLTTIVSRARVTRLPVLTWQQVRDVLVRRGMTQMRAEQLADISAGSVGSALSADADEDFLPAVERAVRAVMSVHTAADVPAAAAIIKDDRDRAEVVLTALENFARDRMLVEMGAQPYAQGPQRMELYLQRGTSGKAMLMAVMQMRRHLKSNVSWQSAAEMMFLSLVKTGV